MVAAGSISGLCDSSVADEEGVTNCSRSIHPRSSRAVDGTADATCGADLEMFRNQSTLQAQADAPLVAAKLR